jgi:hypothetical protein
MLTESHQTGQAGMPSSSTSLATRCTEAVYRASARFGLFGLFGPKASR